MIGLKMATKTANSGLAQRVNRSMILRAIQDHSLISRSDLCEITGIKPTQMTRLTRGLLSENLIEEVDKSVTNDAGRKPILLGLNKTSRFIVGVDFGASRTRLVVANMASEVIGRYAVETPASASGDEIVAFLSQAVKDVAGEARIELGNLHGLSVAIGGIIADTPGREVTFASIPAFKRFPLADKLSEQLGMPVHMTSASGVCGLAECENARQHNEDRDFLIVRCGYGVGLIPLLGGKSQVGRQDDFSRAKIDFGHITHDPNGPECLCGSRGCVESYCGGWAIARDAKKNPSSQLLELVEGNADRITAQHVFDAAKRGDKYSMAITRSAGRILGSRLAQFIQFYIPRNVIFSGQLVSENSMFFDEMSKAIRLSMPAERFAQFNLKRTALDEYASAVGATSVMIHDMLHEPIDDLVRVAW